MPAAPLSFRRKLLFGALLAGAGLIFLLASLELGLRLGGYGHSPHFARRETLPTGETVWRDNRWCTAPYFSPELVRRPVSFRLPAKKEPGTYRIFVLGSSAAMGDPEASFSFARVLEAQLRAAYPQQRFEVVNAAITAINSHVVRGIAADCARLEPDLFIVYEGNNEVIGPFGPAGVFAPFFQSTALLRTTAWMKTTRTGQLVSTAAARLWPPVAGPGGWRGMQMFLQQQLAADDPRLAVMRGHFAANLRAIAHSAADAGAATLLCTVLTNQRDFAPFASVHRAGLSAEDLARWQTEFAAAEAAARGGDRVAEERHYRAALAIDDRHAELVYRLGRLALAAGRADEARPLLARALDLDTLRFRTDSALNDTIRRLGTENLPGVRLVDVAQTVATRTAHGVPGDDLLYEHVHLTFRGAYEVAGELFAQVAAELARRGVTPTAAPLDYETAKVRLGFTTYEQAMIALELQSRFRAAPFSGQSDQAIRLRTWVRRSEQLTALLARPEARPALTQLYAEARAAAPDDWMLARNAGMMHLGQGEAAAALPLLQQARAWIGDDVDTLIALARTQEKLGEHTAATTIYAEARRLEPRHPALPPVR